MRLAKHSLRLLSFLVVGVTFGQEVIFAEHYEEVDCERGEQP